VLLLTSLLLASLLLACPQVDEDPRILVEGHEDVLENIATHAEDPDLFATGCASGKVRPGGAGPSRG
jgi:hypothetical protein